MSTPLRGEMILQDVAPHISPRDKTFRELLVRVFNFLNLFV